VPALRFSVARAQQHVCYRAMRIEPTALRCTQPMITATTG
jgi:hypothetical protein